MKQKIGRLMGVVLLLLCGIATGMQATDKIKLNEILVINENSNIDNVGQHSPWIEIYNNSPRTVDLGGCYFTNDKNNPKKCMIPKGRTVSSIAPHQHLMLYVDGHEMRGIFHMNFTFDRDKENYLALYDSDGHTLIDEVTIPAGQKADCSYGLSTDGGKEWVIFNTPTAGFNNATVDSNAKIEEIIRKDSSGLGITIISMAVVFLGLLLLFLSYKVIGNVAIKASQRRALKASGNQKNGKVSGPVSGPVIAVITAALYEISEDVHDIENTVLTINKVARTYSPWNSKIYNLRETPKR